MQSTVGHHMDNCVIISVMNQKNGVAIKSSEGISSTNILNGTLFKLSNSSREN